MFRRFPGHPAFRASTANSASSNAACSSCSSKELLHDKPIAATRENSTMRRKMMGKIHKNHGNNMTRVKIDAKTINDFDAGNIDFRRKIGDAIRDE
jgi:hypothetical protein